MSAASIEWGVTHGSFRVGVEWATRTSLCWQFGPFWVRQRRLQADRVYLQKDHKIWESPARSWRLTLCEAPYAFVVGIEFKPPRPDLGFYAICLGWVRVELVYLSPALIGLVVSADRPLFGFPLGRGPRR